MATGNDIGLAVPSTITHRLATITQSWNSTTRHQELMTLAGGESTLEISRVLATNPASTDYGLAVRAIAPTLTTYAASTTGQSSATTIVSSNATTFGKVCAFTVSSTIAGPLQCGFYSSATLLWPVTLWAAGGQITQSVAVQAPGYLFAGAAGNAITFNVPSTGAYQVAVSYWS